MSNTNAHQEHMYHVIKYGIARSNRFNVMIPLPKAIQGNDTSSSKSSLFSVFGVDVLDKVTSILSNRKGEEVRGLAMTCEQTEMPGKSFTTSDVKYSGEYFRVPYNNVFGLHSFTFHVSGDLYEKAIIDTWMSNIINEKTQEIEYYDNYVSDITISTLDTQGKETYSVVLKDAYPVFCNPVTMSHNESDSGCILIVQFSYKRWEPLTTTASSGVSTLAETPLGKFLTPVLANPIVKEATNVLKNNGIDLEGDAVQYYNMADKLLKNTTNSNINKTVSLLNGMQTNVKTNNKISASQTASVISMLRSAVGSLSK